MWSQIYFHLFFFMSNNFKNTSFEKLSIRFKVRFNNFWIVTQFGTLHRIHRIQIQRYGLKPKKYLRVFQSSLSLLLWSIALIGMEIENKSRLWSSLKFNLSSPSPEGNTWLRISPLTYTDKQIKYQFNLMSLITKKYKFS